MFQVNRFWPEGYHETDDQNTIKRLSKDHRMEEWRFILKVFLFNHKKINIRHFRGSEWPGGHIRIVSMVLIYGEVPWGSNSFSKEEKIEMIAFLVEISSLFTQ